MMLRINCTAAPLEGGGGVWTVYLNLPSCIVIDSFHTASLDTRSSSLIALPKQETSHIVMVCRLRLSVTNYKYGALNPCTHDPKHINNLCV